MTEIWMNICYLLISAILVQPVSKKKGLGESHFLFFRAIQMLLKVHLHGTWKEAFLPLLRFLYWDGSTSLVVRRAQGREVDLRTASRVSYGATAIIQRSGGFFFYSADSNLIPSTSSGSLNLPGWSLRAEPDGIWALMGVALPKSKKEQIFCPCPQK